ncbi:MAG TPA: STAS domain-containing protein [Candidatus Binatus sp.]|jgi:anti-anti-sigma factor|nr:STAS domain-containing protein [Candidatus Binatus sp.]
MAMGLEISKRVVNGVTIVDLQGRATIGENTDKLDHALRKLVADGTLNILMNLAQVTMMDSSGIAAMVGTYVSLIRGGGSLKLSRPSARVREVLRAMRLLDSIPTFDNETEALNSFGSTAQSASSQ